MGKPELCHLTMCSLSAALRKARQGLEAVEKLTKRKSLRTELKAFHTTTLARWRARVGARDEIKRIAHQQQQYLVDRGLSMLEASKNNARFDGKVGVCNTTSSGLKAHSSPNVVARWLKQSIAIFRVIDA